LREGREENSVGERIYGREDRARKGEREGENL
jgi:hypothetical protein